MSNGTTPPQTTLRRSPRRTSSLSITSTSTQGASRPREPPYLSQVALDIERVTGPQAKELDRLAALAVYAGNLPLSLFGSKYFQDYIYALLPGYKLPSRRRLVGELLPELRQEIQREIEHRDDGPVHAHCHSAALQDSPP